MRRADDDGAVAVEFALVLPLLVVFLFGILQFGLLFYRLQGMQAVAHEGARGGSVGLTIAEIQTRIDKALSVPVDFADLRIEVVLFDTQTSTEVQRIDGKTTDPALLATAPCEGIANPERHTLTVELSLDPNQSKYQVQIPVWGTLSIDHGAHGTFGCEATA